MDIKLVTTPSSPASTSVKMYLNMLGVTYLEYLITEDEGALLGELPIVLVDDNEVTRGFNPKELKENFG